MRIRMPTALPGTLLFLLTLAWPLGAQQGVVAGRVVDAETSQPLGAAQIQVLGAAGAQAGGVLSNQAGEFRLELPPGTYSLISTLVGYGQVRVDGVKVAAGGTTSVEITMSSTVFELNPVVITASRHEEKSLESPSTIVTVGAERVNERVALSAVEHVKALPGVDISQTGLTQSNVVTRGFNNVFSGALLVMQDNRYLSVPSLRFNAYNMIPATQMDIDRVEVLLGPAAALYGPNSANGVLHLITSSPIDKPGSTISLAGGERSVFHGQFRSAVKLSETSGIKVSGQYFRGDDWVYRDPAEVPDASNPLIAARDFDAERFGGEIRYDVRPWDDGALILTAGLNDLVNSIELTGIGAAQAKEWKYSYGQARFTKGRLFAQAFINKSAAGDTYLLRTGQSIVDESRMYVGQIQHGFDVGDRFDVTYGVDLQRTEPRTGGTITGRNEDDDIINEAGGYVHAKASLSDKLDLIGALRVDDHSELDDLNYSPRAALVLKPTENQTFRLTFNRAFDTPTTNNLFLDILAGNIPIPGTAGYGIRTLGSRRGFAFTDTCAGGVQNLCMYSPFAPPGTKLPANGAVLWNGLVTALVPATLQPALLVPDGLPDIGSRLGRFNQEVLTFVFPDPGPTAIKPIKSTINNTFEAGYKGILGGKLLVSADAYRSHIQDFVGPLRVETPTVFYDPASLQAFVTQRLAPLVQGGLIPPETIAQLVTQFAQVPLGTVAPDGQGNTDLLLTYRNFGDVNLWGADFAFQLLANDRLSLTGTYSWVSKECVDFDDDGSCSSARDISLNAPANKGSLGLRWDDKVRGYSFDTRVRFSDSFTMNSGVYIGDIDSYQIVDANVQYQLPFAPRATLTLTATNLFDDVHREFIGAPELGRLLLTRLTYSF